MTTKFITSYVAAGYTLAAAYDTLASITMSSIHRFVAAAASLGSGAGAPLLAGGVDRPRMTMIAAPKPALARPPRADGVGAPWQKNRATTTALPVTPANALLWADPRI